MKASGIKLCQVLDIEKELEDGKYSGIWGGNVVSISINDKDTGLRRYQITTDIGIRTPAAECTVTVSDGEVKVEIG
jgi:hypothetical protein